MHATASQPLNFRDISAALKRHYRLWVVPTVVLTLLSLVYALVRPVTWRASQAIVVRDEAIGSLNRQGRFDSTDALKAAQETILEVARNPNTVRAALEDVGPPEGHKTEGWPTRDDVEALQESINITPPRGAEFGSTEVIHLVVEARSRQRAIDLVRAVGNRLEEGLKQMRNQKAGSVLVELENTLHLAEADLAAATARLAAMEREVGSDLPELRILNNSTNGDSNLSRVLTHIESQLQDAKTAYQADLEQEKALEAARKDPNRLVAASSDLLESQPALRRLKEGLIDAQLRTASIKGKMNPDHPLVQAAVTAEEEVRRQLADELDLTLRGIRADLELQRARIESLKKHQAEMQEKLDHLAGLRAEYGNLVAEVRQRTAIVEEARRALSDARANRSSAQSTSLITRIDQPQAGNRPEGPGKATIVLAGMFGGLAAGIGLVFLVAPLGAIRGRRWTDFFPRGRRATDRPADAAPVAGGRRATDVQPANRRATDPPTTGRRATDPKPTGRRATDVPPAAPLPPVPEQPAAPQAGVDG